MKRIYIQILSGIALVFGLSSCEKTDGTLYTGEGNQVSFFNTSTSVPMEGGTVSIPMGRTSSSGTLSIPVMLAADGEGYTDVFSVDGPVAFEDGQSKSYVTISYGDFSTIQPSALSVSRSGLDVIAGVAFPLSLAFDEEHVSPTNLRNVNVLASSTLEFEAPVTTELNSEEGWMGSTYDIQIAKAVGADVYKVIEPFGYSSFAFMIRDDGTIVCPNQIIANNSQYGEVTMGGVTGNVVDSNVVLQVTGYTVAAGSFGGGVEIIKLP